MGVARLPRRSSPRLVAAALLVALLAGCFQSAPPPTLAPPIIGQTERSGYVAARDGTLLAYDLVLPGNGNGTFPTLFEYSGYAPGEQVDRGYVARFVPKGYALLGVNVRGTGCSAGGFDFLEPAEATDGYDIIEWAANQSWSNGKVAMIGKSFPGIAQILVAGTRPPHLVAAAPGHVIGDSYRDVAYPGGILNYAFSSLWSFVAQPEPGDQASANATARGDQTCARNSAGRQGPSAAQNNAFSQAVSRPLDDAFWHERSPLAYAGNITVPLYLFQSWQDEQVGPRGLDIIDALNASTPYFLTVSNGDHGMYRTERSLERLERFFDHFVKGADNGFERSEPRVVVWWEAGALGTRAPSWTTSYDAWPVAAPTVAPLALHLRAGGILAASAPTSDEPADAYVYPAGSSSDQAGYGYTNATWPVTGALGKTPAPTRATFVTDAFQQDTLVLGTGNLTLWLASTATDTDVQATISEVRPDGHVEFVQRGWLRASHRALDTARSTLYRPYQTHTQADALAPGGAPVELNVEIFPMGHAFRAGSRLRLDVEAPTTTPELWGFAPQPYPALNSLAHDKSHDATLVLPVLVGARAETPLPPCGSVIRQSCA